MLDSFSEKTQLVILVIGIAALFMLIMWNTGRNKSKLYGRNKRDFKKNYLKKKKDQD